MTDIIAEHHVVLVCGDLVRRVRIVILSPLEDVVEGVTVWKCQAILDGLHDPPPPPSPRDSTLGAIAAAIDMIRALLASKIRRGCQLYDPEYVDDIGGVKSGAESYTEDTLPF